MREIKFRTFDVNENWTYFALDPETMLKGVSNPLKSIIQEEEGYEIMQFTGMKDSNGVEIYEGDHFGEWLDPVKFNDGAFWYKGKLLRESLPIEIKGNIYENI